MTRVAIIAVWASAAAGCLAVGASVGGGGMPNDLGVYLQGAGGADPYAGNFSGWRFTYPPFAALILEPLTRVDSAVLVPAWSVLIAAAALVSGAAVVWAVTPVRGIRRHVIAAAAGTAALLSYPSISGIAYGNLSALLVALCVVDLLVLRSLATGALSGLAAGVKLTSAILVVPLALRGRWRAVLTLAGTAAATVVVAWVWSRDASARYWGQLLWETDRVGGESVGQSWSLLSVFSRHSAFADAAGWLWIGASGVILVVVAVLSRRGTGRGWTEIVLAWGLVGCLVTPVTWSHHALWLPLGALALLVNARAGVAVRAAAGAVVAWSLLESLPGVAPRMLLERGIGGQWINDLPAAAMLLTIALLLRPSRAGAAA